jgi:hypothetical protein
MSRPCWISRREEPLRGRCRSLLRTEKGTEVPRLSRRGIFKLTYRMMWKVRLQRVSVKKCRTYVVLKVMLRSALLAANSECFNHFFAT